MKSSYQTGKALATVEQVLGFLMMLGGLIACVNISVPVGLGIVMGGVFAVSVAQLLQAQLDTADYTREMLSIMTKEQVITTAAAVDAARQQAKAP